MASGNWRRAAIVVAATVALTTAALVWNRWPTPADPKEQAAAARAAAEATLDADVQATVTTEGGWVGSASVGRNVLTVVVYDPHGAAAGRVVRDLGVAGQGVLLILDADPYLPLSITLDPTGVYVQNRNFTRLTPVPSDEIVRRVGPALAHLASTWARPMRRRDDGRPAVRQLVFSPVTELSPVRPTTVVVPAIDGRVLRVQVRYVPDVEKAILANSGRPVAPSFSLR